ncbi:MAG: DUF917 family protein, partial [Rhodothermales bacterium]|nr:DUF917 family protein [Rhodothermales bacterium]
MRTIQNRQDLEDILNGTCILGSGGGGPYSVGNALIEPIMKAGGVKLIEPSEAGDADHMAVAAGVGSPEAATSDPGAFAKIPVIAFDALAKMRGVTFDNVLSVEIGAGNSFVPMAVAATQGIPMIDGSGAGRAVPSLTM